MITRILEPGKSITWSATEFQSDAALIEAGEMFYWRENWISGLKSDWTWETFDQEGEQIVGTKLVVFLDGIRRWIIRENLVFLGGKVPGGWGWWFEESFGRHVEEFRE